METSTKDNLKVTREAAISLFLALNIKTAPNWDNVLIHQRLKQIKSIIDGDTQLKGNKEEDKNLLKLVLESIKSGDIEDLEIINNSEESEKEDEEEMSTETEPENKETLLEVPETMEETSDVSEEDTNEEEQEIQDEKEAEEAVESETKKTKTAPKTTKSTKKTTGGHGRKHNVRKGTVLERVYKGKNHKVTAVEDGFEYKGKEYPSLTVVAKLITGAPSISGPKFFGLV